MTGQYSTPYHMVPFRTFTDLCRLPQFVDVPHDVEPLLQCNTSALIDELRQEDTIRLNDCFAQSRLVYQNTATSKLSSSPYTLADTPIHDISQIPSYYKLRDTNDTTLIFESRFECGNLQRVIQIDDYAYDLYLSNDTNCQIDCIQWFLFTIRNTRSGCTYKFHIVNFTKPSSLFNDGMQPVQYSVRAQNGWRRFGTDIAYYKINRKNYQLTFSFQCQHTNDCMYMAYHEPYSYSRLQYELYTIQHNSYQSQYCQQSTLCQSVAGNDVYRLTITDTTYNQQNKHKIVVTARVHPGETNASFVMHGLIQYLLSDDLIAQQLRQQCVFELIPMLNVDGVIVGNYRSNMLGIDLNRVYNQPNIQQHPSIHAFKHLMSTWNNIYAYFDIHGHSRSFNVFTYGIQRTESQFDNRIVPLLLSQLGNAFNFQRSHAIVSKRKQNTARIALAMEFQLDRSYTIECSLGGCLLQSYSYAFNSVHYREIAVQLCKCIHILLNNSDRTQLLTHQLAAIDLNTIDPTANTNLSNKPSTDVASASMKRSMVPTISRPILALRAVQNHLSPTILKNKN